MPTLEPDSQPQIFDSTRAQLKNTSQKSRIHGEGMSERQLLILQIQSSQSIEELRAIGASVKPKKAYSSPEWPRQPWDRPFVESHVKQTQSEGGDVGEIIDQSHERDE